jgi:hypothetical protein
MKIRVLQRGTPGCLGSCVGEVSNHLEDGAFVLLVHLVHNQLRVAFDYEPCYLEVARNPDTDY